MSPEIINWTQADCNNQFISGNSAMQVNGPWQINSIRANAPDKNWAVTLVPRADDGVHASCLGGENFGITTSCTNIDEAFQVLAYICETQNNAEYCVAAGKISPRSDSIALVPEWVDDPIWNAFTRGMAYAMPRGPHARWPEISKAIYTALHEVYTGTKDVQTALDGAAEIVNGILAQ